MDLVLAHGVGAGRGRSSLCLVALTMHMVTLGGIDTCHARAAVPAPAVPVRAPVVLTSVASSDDVNSSGGSRAGSSDGRSGDGGVLVPVPVPVASSSTGLCETIDGDCPDDCSKASAAPSSNSSPSLFV